MTDDCNINKLAKNQVSAVFHSHSMGRSVSSRFIELCTEMPCLCPLEWHKHGGHNIHETKTILSLRFAIEMKNVNSRAPTHWTKINVPSSASTVWLVKTEVITHLLTYTRQPFLATIWCHATGKLGNSNMLYYTKKNPVEKNIAKCQVP